MKNNKLTIGQMAKVNHTTISTLRLYERMGLLRPATVDPQNGYRYYDMEQSAILRAIQGNTALGLSLKETKTILDRNCYSLAEQYYQEELEKVKQQRQQLLLKEHMLHRAIVALERFQNLPPAGTITLQFLRSEPFYGVPADRDYFHEDFASYLYGVHSLYPLLEQAGIPFQYQFFSGMELDGKAFRKHRYRAARLGIYVDDLFGDRSGVTRQKGSIFACTYVDDFANLSTALDQLVDFCFRNRYQLEGAPICRLLRGQSPQKLYQPAPFLRLQIPVQVEPAAGEKDLEGTNENNTI